MQAIKSFTYLEVLSSRLFASFRPWCMCRPATSSNAHTDPPTVPHSRTRLLCWKHCACTPQCLQTIGKLFTMMCYPTGPRSRLANCVFVGGASVCVGEVAIRTTFVYRLLIYCRVDYERSNRELSPVCIGKESCTLEGSTGTIFTFFPT